MILNFPDDLGKAFEGDGIDHAHLLFSISTVKLLAAG